MNYINEDKIKGIVGIILAILTTLAIIYGVYTHVLSGHNSKTYTIDSKNNIADEITLDGPISNLNIDVDISEINIAYGDSTKVSYNLPKELVPSVNIKDGTLEIKSKHNGKISPNLGTDGFRIDILLSQDSIINDASINLSLGDIKINNIEANELAISAACGDIEFSNIKTNKLTIDEDLGDVELDSITCNNLLINQSAGDITIINSSIDNSDIDSDLGDIKLDGTLNKIKADCSLGEIKVNSSIAQKDMTLDLNTSLGEITVNGHKYSTK